jgi:glucoamylase
MNPPENSIAFGAPGIEPRWTSSAKEGVGTAYHTSCRVWFTLSHGIVNEIYYPHVDQPNTRDFQLLISDGETFSHEEKRYSFAVALAEKFPTVEGRLSSIV